MTNQVEGQTTIISIKPEGTSVRKGELVCELDSATLRDQLVNQRIATQQAGSDMEQAKKTRDVAEVALREYVGGTYPSNMEAAEDALKLAATSLVQAAARYEWSSRMVAKGYLTPLQNASDRDSKINCEITLDNSQTKIRVLKTYTRQKTITSLEADIAKARSDELAKQVAFGLEQSKRRKLETQIARCKLYAPINGMISYANDDMTRAGSNQTMVEEGATVRERQRIFRVPDITHMRVNAKIHESLIDRLSPGEKARIRVDALPGQVLEGHVTQVQPIADPSQPPNFEVHVYTVLITVDQSASSLRPGMTAQVEILASQTDDILAVPVQAVLTSQGTSKVFVRTPAGLERRAIRLGTCNDQLVAVVEGLRDGDEVALDPVALMTDQEKRAAFILGPVAAQGDDWSEAPAGTQARRDREKAAP